MPPPTLIDRSKATDLERWWRNSHELDQVASWILATVWSGTNAQGTGSQIGEIALRTVAVVRLDTQVLLVATNAVSTDAHQIQFNPSAKRMRSTPNYYYHLAGFQQGDVVFEPKAHVRETLDQYRWVEFPPECRKNFDFHAEMALVEYMSQRNLHPSPKYMGVSKPCCTKCKNLLKVIGIQHSFYHLDAVATWQPPDIAPGWRP